MGTQILDIEEAQMLAQGFNRAFDSSFHRRACNWGGMDAMSRWIQLERAEFEAYAMEWQLNFYAQADHRQSLQIACHHKLALEMNKSGAVR